MIEPQDFRRWHATLMAFGKPMKGTELAFVLGRTPERVSIYRNVGVVDAEERIMRLAMAAISADLKPWGLA